MKRVMSGGANDARSRVDRRDLLKVGGGAAMGALGVLAARSVPAYADDGLEHTQTVAEATLVRPAGLAMVHAIRWATAAPRTTPAA